MMPAIRKRSMISVVLLLFVCVIFLTGNSFADNTKICALTAVYEYNGEHVDGVSVQLYYIGELDRNTRKFTPRNEYAKICTPAALGAIDVAANNAALAEQVIGLIDDSGAQAAASGVTSGGKVKFTGLTEGLYLLKSLCPEKYTAEPALICVPQADEASDAWQEQVTVFAKVGKSDVPDMSEAKLDPPVEKVVMEKNGTAPENTEFAFTMTPGRKDYPMPVNHEAVIDPSTGTETVKRSGPGTVEFGSMYFGTADIGKTYTYTIREVKGSDYHYTYDTQEYRLSVTVTAEGENLALKTVYIDRYGETVEKMVFTNVYNDEKTPEKISQVRTGDDTPIVFYLMLAAVSAGVLYTFAATKRRRYHR